MRANRTPMRLQRDRINAPLHQPIPKIMNPRQRLSGVRCASVWQSRAGPEDLGGGAGARPDGRVEVGVVGLFGPEEVLAAEHEVRLRGGYVC